jgi:menaquinone-dependent protoporphyrinogen oxidase
MSAPSAAKLLVVYATSGGSTQEIAHEIARVLRAQHLHVDVKSAADVETVTGYAGCIIGSGVYDGSWMSEVMALVRQHRYTLAHGAVWLFSVGAFGDTHPLIGRFMRREPREIDELTEMLRPRSYRVFAGVIDPRRWPAAGRLFLRMLGGRTGDNRDWKEITAWAEAIAKSITVRPVDSLQPEVHGDSRQPRPSAVA